VKHTSVALAIASALSTVAALPADASIRLFPLATYPTLAGGESGAEIVAYDATTRRAFVINASDNTVDVIDLSDPAAPAAVADLSFAKYGGGVNSVDAKDGLVAIAAEAAVKTDPGSVVFLDAATLDVVGIVPAGALPDMLAFTARGNFLLVANEGEPNSYGAPDSVDPEGSISIVDLRRGVGAATVATAGFGAFVGHENQLRAAGVRIFGPGANAAQDFEPEYLSIDGRRAYVTLQENNAIAVVNITQARVERLIPLGYKSHAVAGNGLDPSDRDDASLIGTWPVNGMYMPDAIATFRAGGHLYLATANEGDAREYDGLEEEERIGDLTLDPVAFPDAATLQDDANLGRLNSTTALGDTDGDDDHDVLYSFGARSISLRDASGALVWDSGDGIEQLTNAAYPDQFNSNHEGEPVRDDRSDSKGPEPEGVAIGRVGGTPYAFLALERIGGVVVYDVTNPSAPALVQYVSTRAFGDDALPGQDDSGPEGIEFVSARESPSGQALLLVGNEISKTVAIFAIEQVD
jgi:DNA-binding beta-propeller fold protein YncE